MSKTDLKEKCGVVAVWDKNNNAPSLLRLALAALQHRGLESAGISVFSPGGKILTHKGMGLVPHILTEQAIKDLDKSKSAIGQNRYATSGDSSLENAQPIHAKNGKYQLAIGHNGNLPDISNLEKMLGAKEKVTSDTMAMAKLLVKQRPLFKDWVQTFIETFPHFQGAYNLTMMTEDGSIYAARDNFGIRPLCIGKHPNGFIIASESVSLDTTGSEFIRDIAPGELVKIDANGKINSYFFGVPKRHQFCIFEYIYFARPDSFMNGRRIKAGRERSGMLLGKRIKKKNIKPDIVIPVFDSGYPAAKGVSKELELPLVDAITTSHYVGRTFIQPGQAKRVAAVGGKHNVVADEVIGKKVVVVDDSAVRLTTSVILARELRKAGAKEIYMAFASPPVVDQCDMGIDMRSKKELPAALYENEVVDVIEKNISELINAEEVIYLPIEDTATAMGGKKEDFYYTPFGGPHPIRDKQLPLPKMKKRIKDIPKICVFASKHSKGSNLGKIIESIQTKDLEAEIVNVLADSNESYSLTRAKENNIPTTVIPYTGNLKDKNERKKYEEKLVKHIQTIKPDLLLLSGWSMVLSDYFITEMQKMEIPVINHHPALLTNEESETVQTSKGRFPVVRGNNKFKASFESPALVSGISVHQILPGNFYDVGPVVMKAEVRKRDGESLEAWEERNREQEYLLLPTAIKRILHVMKHDIDINKGEFRW
ncbi:MAG TPA: formyltransferase family protein [Candidatus Limnocylindrales bacterium]|nr:formyltransferase family protein [Candidatus Limnocylindrales bacterium]